MIGIVAKYNFAFLHTKLTLKQMREFRKKFLMFTNKQIRKKMDSSGIEPESSDCKSDVLPLYYEPVILVRKSGL